MKSFKLKSLLILSLFLCLCCEQYAPEVDSDGITDRNVEFMDKGYSPINKKPHTDGLKNLKIIKTGEVRFQVENVEKSTALIKKTVEQMGGYIVNLQFRNNRYSLENTFTVRIPVKYFDGAIDSINNSATFIDYENIYTKDVTEEFLDLETRLKTKLEVKSRYEDVLRKQAKTVKEILETEEKLGEIQEEIEAAQGRLKYLSNRVAFSTITIELYEKVEYKEEPVSYEKSFLSKSKEAFFNGWTLISQLAIGLIVIWPLILLAAIIYFLIRRRRRKKTANKD